MAVIAFKFDESYNQRSFCLGGWLGEEQEWVRLENQWQRRIDFENRNSPEDQKITRFHAAHLNCYDHDFEHWSPERSARFCKHLLAIIMRRKVGALSVGLDMTALVDVFPGDAERQREVSYNLCIKHLMVELGHLMRRWRPDDQVLLISAHCDWDQEALRAYNTMVDDERWESRRVFAGILPLTWNDERAVGLQAADLIAYETFKLLDKKLFHNSNEMRKALQALVNESIPMSAKYINKPVLQQLPDVLHEAESAEAVSAAMPEASTDEKT